MSVMRPALKRKGFDPIILAALVLVAAFFGYLGYVWLATPGVSRYYGGWKCDGVAGPNFYGIAPSNISINARDFGAYSVETGSNGDILLTNPTQTIVRIEDRNGRVRINGYGNCTHRPRQ